MPGWDDILVEVSNTPSQYDYLRKKYIKLLSEYTKRNVITYYSSFLSKQNVGMLEINDADMEGFMNAVKGMDSTKGLDLVLHTPGGDPSAAEAIVKYLKIKFNNDIRVIVPHLAMSAGTMIACASKEIVMGKQSSLGPIDPQFNGIPAHNIKSEFEDAQKDLSENPNNAQYWAIKLQQYPAAFLKQAIDAIELSELLVNEWLRDNMFSDAQEDETVKRIVSFLNDHSQSKIHARHFSLQTCEEIGLKISKLEDDDELQDLVLSVHHISMITLQHTAAVKIIENGDKSFVTGA